MIRIYYRGLEIETDSQSAPDLLRWIEKDQTRRMLNDEVLALEVWRRDAVDLAARITNALASSSRSTGQSTDG